MNRKEIKERSKVHSTHDNHMKKKEETCCKKPMSGRIFTGLVFIVIGLLFFLNMTGIITYPIIDFLKSYWPIFIILAGIAIIFRAGFMAFLLVLAGIIFACTMQIPSINFHTVVGDATTYESTIIPEDVENVDITMSYGAGAILIGSPEHSLDNSSGNSPDNNSISSSVITRINPESGNDFIYTVEKTNDLYSIDISGNDNARGFRGKNNFLQMDVPQGKEYSFDLSYGAAKADMDFSRISVKRFNIDSGAASTRIKFGEFPTKGEINTGASSIELEFPQNYNVIVNIDGLVSVSNSNGFNKEGNSYVHKISENIDTIEINIDAGVTDVKLAVYTE